jgi:hypothetical protein
MLRKSSSVSQILHVFTHVESRLKIAMLIIIIIDMIEKGDW